MKKADLEKLKGGRIEQALARSASPARFGKDAGAAAVSRRDQRRLDQAQGLIPFAVKIDGALVEQVRAQAASREITVDELVTELLRKALAA